MLPMILISLHSMLSIRSPELVFDDYTMIRFIDGAGENVCSERTNPVLYSLNLQLHIQCLPEQLHIFGLGKPRSKVFVLVRPSFC
jgi:hypothetical protein